MECRWSRHSFTFKFLEALGSLASRSPLAPLRVAAPRLGRVRVVYEDYRYR